MRLMWTFCEHDPSQQINTPKNQSHRQEYPLIVYVNKTLKTKPLGIRPSHDWGAYTERRDGSSPSVRTKKLNTDEKGFPSSHKLREILFHEPC